MIIELARVFVDFDPEDKEFSKLKQKSKKASKGKCYINAGWISYLDLNADGTFVVDNKKIIAGKIY